MKCLVRITVRMAYNQKADLHIFTLFEATSDSKCTKVNQFLFSQFQILSVQTDKVAGEQTQTMIEKLYVKPS